MINEFKGEKIIIELSGASSLKGNLNLPLVYQS